MPSVHFTIAVFPAVLPVAFGFVVSAGLGGFGAAVFGLAAVVAGLLSLFDASAFFTPPWLEQAPLPRRRGSRSVAAHHSGRFGLSTGDGRETRERGDCKER